MRKIILRGLAVALVAAWMTVPRVTPKPAPTQTIPVVSRHVPERASRSTMSVKRKIILWVTGTYRNPRQAEAMLEIIYRESRFNPYALNETSGAYGLAQALPPSKYESVGGDWRWNIYTQLEWMRVYVESRYGSPMSALRHHDEEGWY